ncbi:DUF4259 domain-containing protein [Limnoglobus roseus]|uniref:DUF4259 domain-containing protein n=1 Tax=Limnoglobus roseus TaxID=2598579 RepID=A0A5C1A7B2_9BACT|nr:DUF4259 domain-containing protein [Limnoglobus roseus]QEL14163.1 hypothetical protein PX52LOC_01033 [Limnoglobus roseus]
MGSWGPEPWANDTASDWYDDLFEQTGFARRVEEAMRLDVSGDEETVRAAAYLVVVLARGTVWPGDRRAVLELAASKLQEMLDREDELDLPDHHLDRVREELQVLRDRLAGGRG